MSENPPAFPVEWAPGLAPDEPMQTGEHTAVFPGMSLRDWFAGQALMGITANSSTPDQLIGFGWAGSKDAVAEYAYAAADAMIAARSTKGEDR